MTLRVRIPLGQDKYSPAAVERRREEIGMDDIVFRIRAWESARERERPVLKGILRGFW